MIIKIIILSRDNFSAKHSLKTASTMNINYIIGTIEPSDIARAEQQVLVMESEHQDNRFNMLAIAE